MNTGARVIVAPLFDLSRFEEKEKAAGAARMEYIVAMESPTPLAATTLAIVIACWIAFSCVFVFRKQPQQKEAKRDRRSLAGIVLQMCAYAVVSFQPPRAAFLPPLPNSMRVLGPLISVCAIGLAIGSVWFAAAAARALGQQWAFSARLIEGHKLITEGPYSVVRNPIYTGMLGLLIATGLAMEHWRALVIATPLFMAGLVIRVRSEEKLLRSAFGEEFEEYAKRVPAVIPGIY
jgi:protein-S-isoprenylcysteine O-methyltransferase Ste14